MQSNQATKVQLYTTEDMKLFFPSVLGKAKLGGRSRFDDDLFHEAVKIAKANPNHHVKFFEFSHEELEAVKREANSCNSFVRSYFKRHSMTNFTTAQYIQGNKVVMFIVNITDQEEE